MECLCCKAQMKKGTTVPFHKGRDISPRLLRQIASDVGLSIEEMLESE